MVERTGLEQRIALSIKNFVNSKSTSCFEEVISTTSELTLGRMEYWERFVRKQYDQALTNSSSRHWLFWRNNNPSITLLDLASWDGLRRERALKSVNSDLPNRFFMALAIRRLNDWVPQVRLAASKLMSQLLAHPDPASVADVIFFTFCHWSSWQRIDDTDRNAVFNVLANPRITEYFISILINSSAGPLVSVLSELGRSSVIDNQLEEIARQAVQPWVRAKAYRSLLERRITWVEGRKWQWTDRRYNEGKMIAVVVDRELTITVPFLSTLYTAANDRSSIVRRVAAEMLIKNLESVGIESLS